MMMKNYKQLKFHTKIRHIDDRGLLEYSLETWKHDVDPFKILQFREDIEAGFFNTSGVKTIGDPCGEPHIWKKCGTRLTLTQKGKNIIREMWAFSNL